MNMTSKFSDYETGEDMTSGEMGAVMKGLKQGMSLEEAKKYAGTVSDISERAKIRQSGLNALGYIPRMLPKEGADVATHILKPYIAEQAGDIEEQAAIGMTKPLYQSYLERTKEKLMHKKEESELEENLKKNALERSRLKLMADEERLRQQQILTNALRRRAEEAGFGSSGKDEYGRVIIRSK